MPIRRVSVAAADWLSAPGAVMEEVIMGGILAFAAESSSFVKLFAEMNPWTIVLFVIGLLFCIVELFTPGFGFFGISGICMLVAAIVLRLIFGGDALMLVYMLLIVGSILVLLFVVFDKIVKRGKFRKNSIFDAQPSVSEVRPDGVSDFSSLVGSSGVAKTALRPVGKADFDGTVVDVVARDGFVEQGQVVTVVATDGPSVIVVQKV